MRPQSASAGTSSRLGAGDGEQLAPRAAGAWAPPTAEPLSDELGSQCLLTQPVEGELEAVLLETVSTLTAERGRLAEQ